MRRSGSPQTPDHQEDARGDTSGDSAVQNEKQWRDHGCGHRPTTGQKELHYAEHGDSHATAPAASQRLRTGLTGKEEMRHRYGEMSDEENGKELPRPIH